MYIAGSRQSLLDAKHADEHGTVWERRWPELGGSMGRLEMRLRRREHVRVAGVRENEGCRAHMHDYP
jgi:hypothetical protein